MIIRGGGAVGDLAYLNDYELAALVAEQPVPVWVGIGHERDRVILDEVAQRSFDTPSKVIAGIINQLRTITEAAQQAFLQIEQLAKNQLAIVEKQSQHTMQSIKNLAEQRLNYYSQQCDSHFNQIKNNSYAQLTTAQIYADQYRDMILLQHPSRVLSQGYAVVRDGDTIVKSVLDLTRNQTIKIELQDGTATAMVQSIKSK